ncbi:diacylglycerol/lipid kinase family protein [Lacibacterium aquatile]|uniref:Diacylglycerol/lipid kinase family protein n=1 Tax=Lacibacterium aquatile TaxID=1168082 RepID=A0ABW5DUK2_9PROT
MRKAALIRNPRSTRNRKRGKDLRGSAEIWLGNRFIEPASVTEIPAILSDLAAQEVDWIIVDGGDGTVRDVMTPLPEAFGDRLPKLSIIPSGNTNVIAADVGRPAIGIDALVALKSAAETGSGEINSRPCLEITREAGDPLLRGMFFGVGMFRLAAELAHKSDYHDRIGHGPAVAIAIARAAYQVLAGKPDSLWRGGEEMVVRAGDDAPRSGRHLLVLATTLQKLVLGAWPFWNEHQGPIQFLDADAPPEKMVRALYTLLRGKAPDWMRQGDSYRSHGVSELHIQLANGFVLDGESYATGPSGLRIATGPTFDYFRP